MSRFRLGIALGLIAGIVAALIALRPSGHDAAATLTEAAYESASQRWDRNGPKSYDLDLVLSGKRPGNIHVEVRNGEVTHMLRDGVEPKQRRTWYPWTVPGQFDTIGQEIEMARDPVAGFQAPPGSRVVQRASFDPRYGYPRVYQRTVLGTDLDIGWQVTHFAPIDQDRPGDEK